MVEWLREAKNRGRNFAFAGEIYLLDFFRLTRQPVGRGEVRSFVGEVLMIAESKLLLYAKDEETDGLSQSERGSILFFFFSIP